jgi:regulatory protein
MKKNVRTSKSRFSTAYEYGLYLLEFRDRSESELIRRFKLKSFQDDDIASAIEKLKRYGFLNEERTVSRFITALMQAGWGNYMIRAKLLQKGFPIDIINNYLASISQSSLSQQDRAYSETLKKIGRWKLLSAEQQKQKVFMYLKSRGFDYDAIAAVWNRIRKERNE